MNIFGRLVAEKYKIKTFGHPPELVFKIRTWEGKQEVAIPAPLLPQFFVRIQDLEAVKKAFEGNNIGLVKYYDIPTTEAWTADEHAAVTRLEVNDPHTVSKCRKLLVDASLRVYEADIPFTRVVKRNLRIYDNKVRIHDGELLPYAGDVPDMIKGFYDIETDDSGIHNSARKQRIFGMTLATDQEVITWVEEEESQVLGPFLEKLNSIDLLVGWGSEDFDDERVLIRTDVLQLPYDPRDIQKFDLLKTLVYREGKRLESLRLEAVTEEILVKEFKVYPKTVERYKGYYKLFAGEDGGRARLGAINRSHAVAVRDIDKYLGLLSMRVTMADIAGIQVEDTYYYSRVIDSIVLREYFNQKPRLIAPCRTDDENIGFEGAHVFDPKTGLHKNVLHLDLVSLYNRIVQTFNISPELWPIIDKSDFDVDSNGKITLTSENYERLIKKLAAQPEGIFPRKMRELEVWRKQTKAEKNKYKANMESPEYKKWSTLDSTIKTLILAFYGQLGEAKSRYFIPLMAGLVTYAGREILMATAKWLEEMGFVILYGDTDSIFCIPAVDLGETTEQRVGAGRRIEELLNTEIYPNLLTDRWGIPTSRMSIQEGKYKGPSNGIQTEFQEVYTSIFFGEGKKRYAGMAYQGKEPEVKGFEVVRGDWCPLARSVQSKIIDMRLSGVPKADIENYLVATKNDVLDGKYTKELVISKGQKVKEYKVKPAHQRAADKIAKGDVVQGDSKIHYVVTKADKSSIVDVQPVIQGAEFPKIEFSGLVYYWTKQVAPPAFRILWGLFSEEDQEKLLQCHYTYKESEPDAGRLDFHYA
jgi:DNA polymerase elongation subunit (family B)